MHDGLSLSNGAGLDTLQAELPKLQTLKLDGCQAHSGMYVVQAFNAPCGRHLALSGGDQLLRKYYLHRGRSAAGGATPRLRIGNKTWQKFTAKPRFVGS